MKTLLLIGLAVSLNALAGTVYAPNNGTAQPGNPGTLPNAAMIDSETTIPSGYADPNVEVNKNLERSNTSPNPIPNDTTLQTGKPREVKQSQEAKKEELDKRTLEGVDQ